MTEKEQDMLDGLIFDALSIFYGGDLKNVNLWLNSFNHHFNDLPINIMKTQEGKDRVLGYLCRINGW